MKWVWLLVIPVALACVVPQDGMIVTNSVNFCSDVYYLNHGITISGSNLLIDCNDALLKSWNGGNGISILHSSNVTVRNCNILNYDIGLYARNSSVVYLENNHLVRNVIGTKFVAVRDSATFNHDVSLLSEFDVLASENNVLSLTNKPVRGDFCADNFCNQPRSSVELFVAPKSDLDSWFTGQLGVKSAGKLFDWVFSDFI